MVIFLVMGCTTTQTVQTTESDRWIEYVDTLNRISFNHPETWGINNWAQDEERNESLLYTVKKRTDLTPEEQNTAAEEEKILKEGVLQAPVEAKTTNKDEIKEKIITLTDGTPLLLTVYYDSYYKYIKAESRFYKNDLQFTISKILLAEDELNGISSAKEKIEKGQTAEAEADFETLLASITFHTATPSVIEPVLKNYTDIQTGISFSYPEKWGTINGEMLAYTATKVKDLSTEKTIPAWEMPNTSPQEEATGEKELLQNFLTTKEQIEAEDFFYWHVQRELTVMPNGTPALVETHFKENESYAERLLRFYKDDWQIVVTLKLPITKTGTEPMEIFENLKKDCVQPEILAEIDLFKTMTDTITITLS